MTTLTTTELDPAAIAQKQGVAYGAYGGLMATAMMHFGAELGLYEALGNAGPVTSSELAARTGLKERFLREWLYHQAAVGVLEFRGGSTFELTPEAAQVFADTDNPSSVVAVLREIPELIHVWMQSKQGFRSGRGNSYDDFGPRIAQMMESTFGAWNRTALVPEALPKLPGVVERLEAGAMVADVGCGGGAAPVAIAKAFPRSTVHGYENSLHALAIAEEAKAAAALENVSFFNVDYAPLPETPTYDFVLTLDCLHDMPRPDLYAAAIRKAIKPDGVWFIADIDGAETMDANLQHPMASLLFGSSITVCLQSGASTPDGLALGTLGLPEPKMREIATAAGFTRFGRVAGLQHPVNAYYEVRP